MQLMCVESQAASTLCTQRHVGIHTYTQVFWYMQN